VIRRHDKPRRVPSAGLREHLFVGALVLVPSIALIQIARLKLPVLRRLVQPLQQTAPLLVWYTGKGLLASIQGAGTIGEINERVKVAARRRP